MNDAVFRPSRNPRVTPLPQNIEGRPNDSRPQDPAIILLIALGISFLTLVVAIGWLLFQS